MDDEFRQVLYTCGMVWTHSYTIALMMRAEIVPEVSVICNWLTWLIVWQDFINVSYSKRFRSHISYNLKLMKLKYFFSDTHRIEPNCHHPSREPHRCHFGDCPPCRQVCGKSLDPCKHKCPAPCHSAVWVKVEEDRKPVGPWDKVQPQVEIKALPCPSCKVSWKNE